MDITWIRDIPLWAKVLLVAFILFLIFAGFTYLKSRNPASRGVERKLQQKRDEESKRYE